MYNMGSNFLVYNLIFIKYNVMRFIINVIFKCWINIILGRKFVFIIGYVVNFMYVKEFNVINIYLF